MDLELTLGRAKAGFFQVIGLTSLAESAYLALLQKRRDVGAAKALAVLLAKKSKFAEAEVWLSRICEWEPANAENWFNAGYVRDSLGLRREAIEAFKQTVRVEPAADKAWHAIGVIYAALGEHENSIKPLRRACELRPANGQAWLNLAQSLHACGRFDEVTEVARKLAGVDRAMIARLVELTGRQDLTRLAEVPDKK